jgi:two-component system sensor histidine kinase MprB
MVLAALVVGVFAILAATIGSYLASRNALINSVDDLLQQTVSTVQQSAADGQGQIQVRFNPDTGLVEAITPTTAQVYAVDDPPQSPTLPITASVRAVAAGTAKSYFTDIHYNGGLWREYVVSLGLITLTGEVFGATPSALQVAAPLAGVNDQLSHLGLALLLVALAALIITVLLGWFVARATVNPLNDLTAAVEEIARTTDVSDRLAPGGADELGRLRAAFNRLLGALERSRESQHQLVLDASHELRTPLTSLRTNLEIVRRIDELSEPEREVLVSDVLTQLQELTNLVGDLAELARGDQAQLETVPLRLDLLVEDAVELANSHGRSKGVTFVTSLEPSWIEGRSDRISRAVGNLLDNALKWSSDGGSVEVSCARGDVIVRDHGPGIDPGDLPHIFDRFYRARAARALPGSGLGLAIVAQVAAEEGGSIGAFNASDGGAVLTLHFPVVPAPAEVPSAR